MIHQKLNPYLAILFLTLIGSATAYWLVWQSSEIEVQDSLPVTVRHQISHATANRIDTSDWKTYRNEKYGFEVKYPQNWKVLETYRWFNFEKRDVFSFVPLTDSNAAPLQLPTEEEMKQTLSDNLTNGNSIILYIDKNPKNLALRLFFEREEGFTFTPDASGIVKDIYLAGMNGIELVPNENIHNNYISPFIAFRKDQLVFQFVNDILEDDSMFTKIIATFKIVK